MAATATAVSALLTASTTGAIAATEGKPQPASDQPTVVATHLDNPRMLAFHGNSLYVAEAGRGGDGPCIGPTDQTCYGATGAVTAVDRLGQRRVVNSLPSIAGPDGSRASGPTDVVPTSHHSYKLTLGLGLDPRERSLLPPAGALLGTQVNGSLHSDAIHLEVDLAAFEVTNNPDGGEIYSNPGGTSTTSDGRTIVADAGANTVLEAFGGQVVSATAMPEGTTQFPPSITRTFESVPTSVAVGPDDATYVSEFTGFPFPAGGATIYRIPPGGGTPEPWATGLTNVSDLAWHRGELYAVQLSDSGLLRTPAGELPKGSLVKVPPGSTSPTTVLTGLTAPYGVAFKHSHAYVTTCAMCVRNGQVLRIPVSKGRPRLDRRVERVR